MKDPFVISMSQHCKSRLGYRMALLARETWCRPCISTGYIAQQLSGFALALYAPLLRPSAVKQPLSLVLSVPRYRRHTHHSLFLFPIRLCRGPPRSKSLEFVTVMARSDRSEILRKPKPDRSAFPMRSTSLKPEIV